MNSFLKSLIAVAAMVAAGCSNSADVSGKVTYNGKPVVYGTVVVVGADGLPRSGAIQPDGSYKVKAVPLGQAKVAVTSPRPPGSDPPPKKAVGRDADDDKPRPEPPPPAPPEVIQNWVALPEKFGDVNLSNITVTVKSGQPADIALR
jgi:hypothetical protein